MHTVLKGLLGVCAAGLLLSGCHHGVAATAPTPAVSGKDPDTELDDSWVKAGLAETETIPRADAEAYVRSVFALVERKIFDRAFYAPERQRAQQEVLDGLAQQPQVTRGSVAALVDAQMKASGMSHLRLLGPSSLARLAQRLEVAQGTPAAAVHSRRVGDVGILTVSSFLVPEIQETQVRAALADVQGAKALLVDVRGNGGGSVSSVVYVAEHFLGPDKLVCSVQTHQAESRPLPFKQVGAIPDALNPTSAGDIELEVREGMVQWWTPTRAAAVPVPVFLLVDAECGSSCDTFAAALKHHRAARLLGERTAGQLLGSVLYKTSWPGYALLAPFANVLSPAGEMVEGVGVAPDVELAECRTRGMAREDPAAADQACLDAALRVIQGP